MCLFLLTVLFGVAWGYGRGGRLTGLSLLSLRTPSLVRIGLGLQLALGYRPLSSLSATSRFTVVLASYALVGLWLALNAVRSADGMRRAMLLVGAGWFLNVLAIVPNGGMPVSSAGLEEVGLPPNTAVSEGHLWKHVAATRSTTFRILGDVIPVTPLRSVLSIGDLAIAGGLAAAVAIAMSGANAPARPSRWRPRDGGVETGVARASPSGR